MAEQLPTLIRKRGSLKAKVTSMLKYLTECKTKVVDLDGSSKSALLVELQLRLDKLDPVWQQFETIQDQIDELADDFDEQLEEREQFESSFYKAASVIKQFLSEHDEHTEFRPRVIDNDRQSSSAHSSASAERVNNIKLPQIKLPIFSGSYENWLEFRDTFHSLIHANEQIGEIQKFHYLRASVEGTAAQVIHSIEFSASNYTMAWELLCERYNNKSLLIHTHVKALFNLPSLTKESSVELRNFIDQISKNLRSLQILEQPTDQWDTLIIYMITGKLDKTTARKWEELKKDGIPTLEEMKEFLKHKADLFETLELNKPDSRGEVSNKSRDTKPNTKTKAFTATSKHSCIICDGAHYIFNCQTFLKDSISKRFERVKALKLCFNCLHPGHTSKDCRSGVCRKCGAAHNTLLHFDRTSETQSKNTSKSEVALTSKTTVSCSPQVLLSTALVQIMDSQGYPHTCRALLDSGAQSNFITAKLCEKLKLPKRKTQVSVSGINQVMTTINERCELTLQSLHNSFEATISCLVMNALGDELPNNQFDVKSHAIPPYIRLADPSFHIPAPIDLIIGAGLFWKLLCVGQHKLESTTLTLQKTRLGWIMTGEPGMERFATQVKCNFERDCNIQLQSQLERFWAIEEYPTQKIFSSEEQQCEEIFAETTTRTDDGRFIVTLPLKESASHLGDSKNTALKRFRSLERKLSMNPEFKDKYIQFMSEYKHLGHMSQLDNTQARKVTYYLPHHGVLNEASLTTKLRVVFDGSAVTDTGYSLNDLQMVGPTLQDELISIILRFRQHTYVVCADVAKMYRQILVAPHQRSLQCILWRENPSAELCTYQLNTVTYGTASAPYLAVKCLRQLGIDCQAEYPQASEVILSDFYVDDMITGGESEESVLITAKEVAQVLQTGCFELRKWLSNSTEILEGLQSKMEPKVVNFGEHKNTKTLGLYWSNQDDVLLFNIKQQQVPTSVTKRTILSQIAQIFDPLGLLSPTIIIAKIILQNLWSCKLSWDESVPPDIFTKWKTFKEQLPLLNTLRIPRHMIGNKPIGVELHGFADASQEAYGACIYLRSINTQGNIHVNLVMSKTRVAPLKAITIPRLELCAATMLAHLVKKVTAALKLSFQGIYFWSDSTVTLHWINTSPHTLQVFVGNRVSQIQSLTQKDDWRHVPSEDNPADLVTRGLTPQNLCHSELWWHGPSWLKKPESEWPKSVIRLEGSPPETKKIARACHTQETDANFKIERYSSLTQAKRVMGYIKRFISNCKKPTGERYTGELTAKEINEALKSLVQIDQGITFKAEKQALQSTRQVSSKSCLFKLTPFLDKDGLLRVGGRLKLATHWPFDQRHQMVLGKTYLSKLVLKHEHEKLGHAGVNHTLASAREHFWPVSGRGLAKKVIHSCMVCFRVKPKITTQLMGNLPSERITPSPPFYNTGVDYAGPLQLKDRQGRGCKLTKAYICLFICMCTKAIHLELATELSKEAFIAAFRRFTSRRGKPGTMHSDNATNFVAANKELAQFLDEHQGQLATTVENEGISWKFIPAQAPHFGGLWEAGVKQVKTRLRKMIGNTNLTYEQLYTILTQIEAILNSRPISPLSSDPNDLNALTPGHFLIGRRITSAPDPDATCVRDNRLSKFQFLQKVQQQFWKRWNKEYIAELQTRVKWSHNQRSLEQGTLVVIKEDNAPPLRWRLGRVIQVFPGPDGITRVASVKTPDGIMKRALSKLCPLPIDECNNVQ